MGWQLNWFFVGGDRELEVEEVPSTPHSFGRRDHGWFSSAPLLDRASSSRVDEIFSLVMAERNAKALLNEGHLRSGTDSQNRVCVVDFSSSFFFLFYLTNLELWFIVYFAAMSGHLGKSGIGRNMPVHS